MLLALIIASTSQIIFATHPDGSSASLNTEENDPYKVREFEIDGPGLINAFTITGNISVEYVENSNTARVELFVDRGIAFWSSSKNLDNYRINMLKRGNEIIASVEPKSTDRGLFDDKITFSFKIYVPREMSTQLKTSGGNIMVSGLIGNHTIKNSGGSVTVTNSRGRIAAYTLGGDIQVDKSSGTIFVQTDGGNITVNDSGGELRLLTTAGTVTANRVEGSMLALVQGGDIYAQFESVAQGINLETKAGNITLVTPHYYGYDLTLSGTQVNIPTSTNFSGQRRNNYVSGQINGGDKTIVLTTSYGTINLNLTGQQ